MISFAAFVSLALAAAPDPWAALPPIPAPLGHLGDSLLDAPEGGVTGGEKVVISKYEGCARDRAVFLTRFVSGAALGGNQLQLWLAADKAVEAAVFKEPGTLARTLDVAREGTFVEGERCQAAPREGWKLELAAVPKSLCNKPRAKPGEGEFWFSRPMLTERRPGDPPAPPKLPRGMFSAVVRVAPAAPNIEDRCRLRISSALFDDKGKARLLFHADYGAALAVEVRGDGCSLDFTFDPAVQGFRARPAKGARCPAPKPR